MVAIFTGSGTGFERGSGSVLGSLGLLGNSSLGRNGEQVMLNAANGNLLISQRDEFLVGRGPDAAISRTYNSLGNFSDENGDNWRHDIQKRLVWHTGNWQSPGSAVKELMEDGSEKLYWWDGTNYVSNEGGGAHDTLTHTGGGWRWTDGGGQITETYQDYGNLYSRLVERSDNSGNRMSFSYSGDKLTQITTADGSWIQYHWSGNNIAQIHTGFTDVSTGGFRTQTRTRYGYDHLNRLTAVTVDLSPGDNHQGADGYTTNYGYHGDSRLVAWISQTDGSRVDFGYDGANRVTHITQQVGNGATRTTTIGYGGGYTNITDPAGQVTTLEYNADGSLRRVVAPPAHWGAGHQTVQFAYNGNGDLTSVTDSLGRVTSYAYDGRGNAISETDRLGNFTTRTYGARNQLLTETRWDAGAASTVGTLSFEQPEVGSGYIYNPGGTGTSFEAGAGVAGNGSAWGFAAAPSGDQVAFLQGAGKITHTFSGLTPGQWYAVAVSAAQRPGYGLNPVTIRANGTDLGTFTPPSTAFADHTTAWFKAAGTTAVVELAGAPSQSDTGTGVDNVRLLARSGAGETTRYVYDGSNRLRFVVSAQGSVSENWYDASGQNIAQSQQRDRYFDVSGLAPDTALELSQLMDWRAGFDKSQLMVQENRYDVRGNLRERISFGGADWHGNAQTADGYTHQYFTYDQSGQLLARTTAPLHTEHFAYDGLGRVRSSTDLNGGTTSIVFHDSSSQTVVTLANGFVQTSTYNKAGELVAFADGGDFVNGGTASHKYDQLGRLRMSTDASGRNSYFLYDKVGRKVADVNHDGHMVEYRYDANDRLVATVRFTHGVGWALGHLQDPNSVLDISQIRPGGHGADVWTWHVYDKEGRLIEAIDGDGGVTAYEYDGSDRLVRTTSFANKLAGWQVADFKNAAPAGPVHPPASGADKVARNFYDKDGRLIGALDGEGYLSQVVYDAAGRKVHEIAYANATRADLRHAHSFNDIVGNLAPHAQDRSSRYVYDGQGLLRFVVNALNQVTEFRYEAGATWTAIGPVRETIEYVGPIAPLGSYTLASVRNAISAAGLAGHGGNRVSRSILDGANRVAYSIDAAGSVTGFSYDAVGQVTKTVQYANALHIGHLPSKGDMDGWAGGNASAADRVTRNYYSDRGELRFVVDAEGFVTRNDYDASGRVVRNVRWATPVGAADWWDIYTVNGALGGAWVDSNFTYDGAGRVAYSYDGEGNHRYFGYHANGTLAWDIAMLGHADESRTYFEYDAAGRVVAEYKAWNTAEQAVTRFGYDGHGNQTVIVDPNGNHSYRGYDKLGRVVSQTDANGAVSTFAYNAFGQVTRATDGRGHSTYTYYDKLGRATHVRDAEDYVTETAYTVFGQVDSVTRRYNKTWNGGNTWDAPGMHHHHLDATTRFEYDRLGRLVKATDAEGHYEQYTLNAFGQRAHVRNKVGGVTVNQYDRRGLLVAQTLPTPSVHRDGWVQAWDVTNRFEYDARGNRTRMIEAAGLPEQRTTTYIYDRADRLIETRGDAVQVVDQDVYHLQADSVPVERVRYDTRGNVIETVDARGARTVYYYDKQNRKVEQVDALNNMISWRYDAAGNLVHERRWAQQTPWADVSGHGWPSITGDDRVTNYTYDRLGRLKTSSIEGVRTGRWDGANYVAWTGNLTTSFDYDANGNRVRTTDANGVATHTYYDRLNRKIRTVDGERHVTGWLYDAEGNTTHERRWALKTGYADLNGWHDPSGGHENDRVTDFTYDRNGRRTSERRLVNGYGHQGGDSVVQYAYNGLGQVVRKIEATAQDSAYWDQHATEYHYDSGGRMTKELRSWYQNNDGNWVRPTTDYSYDGLNNLTRTRQSGDGAWQGERVTRYAYKAGGRLQHMWDANGAQFNYYHNVAGDLVAQTWDRRRSDESYQHEGVLYTRDVLGRVTSQALGSWYGYWAKGDTQGTAYNSFGDISQRGMNGGWQEKFGYDRAGRLDRSNSGDGVWRYFIYDGVGNQTLTIENEGDWDLVDRTTDHALYRAQGHNAHHAGNAYIDGLNVTINIYDGRNQSVETQLRQRQLNSGTIQNLSTGRAYNAFGEVTVERDTRGHHTHFGYNTLGRTLWIERPAVLVRHENGGQEWVRPTERYEYDRSGRLVAHRDANGNRTARALLNGTGYGGSEALVTAEFHADGGVIHSGYDVFGDLRRQTDEIGRTRSMSYDGMARLTQEWHHNGLYEAYGYDLLGQRIHHYSSYYGYSATTDYDVQGRVTRQVEFGGDTTTTSYSWMGWLHTSGMGTFGGWEEVTSYANGRYMVEQSDMFGRDLYKRDLGGHTFGFQYDIAGRLTQRSGGEALNYTYFNTGLASSVYTFNGDYGSQNWSKKSTSYGYDQAGNLTSEYSAEEGEESYYYYYDEWNQDHYYNSWNTVTQNAIAEYDALGRRTHWREHGNAVSPDARIWTEYDANGNVRRTYAEYRTLDQNGAASGYVSTQDLWYRYDAMNRVVTAKGQLQNGQIVRGWQGVDYAYNQAGQRVSASRTQWRTAYIHNPNYTGDPYYDPWDPYGYYYYDPYYHDPNIQVSYEAEVREQYSYDAGGGIAQVRIAESSYYDNYDGTLTVTAPPATGALKANYWYDALGRMTRQVDYLHNGDYNGTVAYDRRVYFNGKGQVANETVITRQGGDIITTHVANQFGWGSDYALGAVTYSHSDTYKNDRDGDAPDTSTTNTYAWYDGAVVSQIRYRPDMNQSATYTTNHYYNGSGHLISAQINDGRWRSVSYKTDLMGQVIRRDESDGNWNAGDPHEVWYRFGGKQMGYTGNNGTVDTDYQTSINDRTRSPSGSNGAFRFGSTWGSAYADFDLSVDPINSYDQGGSGGSYTTRTGDTLASVAANLWGDSSLWYKLAEANGITGSGTLSEGQRLTIPAGVMKNTHNAGTMKPYDPGEVMGDTSPTTPQPQKAKKGGKCGVFGQILLVVVAVAVTALTYGALGGAALGGVSAILAGAAAGAAGSIASQAVGVAFKIQDKFSWKAVGMAAIGGAVSGGVGQAFKALKISAGFVGNAVRGAVSNALTQGIGVATKLQDKFDWAGVAAAGIGAAAESLAGNGLSKAKLGKYGTQALTGSASAIASAATRSLWEGTSFGDNLLAALPDVIGSTIGNMIADPIVAGMERRQLEARIERLAGNDALPDHLKGADATLEMVREELEAGTSGKRIRQMLADGDIQGQLADRQTEIEIEDLIARGVIGETAPAEARFMNALAVDGGADNLITLAGAQQQRQVDPYTAALQARLGEARGVLANFDVDWDFVSQNEGALLQDGYIPRLRGGAFAGNSGVTISTGFDIGQHTASEIRALRLPQALTDRLLPYAAMGPGRPRTRDAAAATLAANPLRISALEAQVIAASVKASKAQQIERIYNRSSRVTLRSLAREYQTVIFDFGFQNGAGYGSGRSTKPVPTRKRQLWTEFTSQNWSAAQDSLRWLGRNEGYGPRRNLQIQRLQTEMDRQRRRTTT